MTAGTGEDEHPSVVICTRNRGARLTGAVESVLASTLSDFELIVVDQSTNDETRLALEPFAADPRLRYVASAESGLGRARNTGLREASGSLVIYTDDDCTVPPAWLSVMVDGFAKDPRVAVVFSNVFAADHDPTLGFIPTYVRSRNALITSVAEKCRARGIGASLAVRRSAAAALGGFDCRLGPGADFPACEDGDMAARALLGGWYIYETTDTRVLHDGFRTWREGRALARQTWAGVGASYVKPLRAGRWDFVVVVLYEAFVVALAESLRPLLRLRRPTGLGGFWWFWRGFFAGLRFPLDRRHLVYREVSVATDGRSRSNTSTPDDMGQRGHSDPRTEMAPCRLPDNWKEHPARATGRS